MNVFWETNVLPLGLCWFVPRVCLYCQLSVICVLPQRHIHVVGGSMLIKSVQTESADVEDREEVGWVRVD